MAELVGRGDLQQTLSAHKLVALLLYQCVAWLRMAREARATEALIVS